MRRAWRHFRSCFYTSSLFFPVDFDGRKDLTGGYATTIPLDPESAAFADTRTTSMTRRRMSQCHICLLAAFLLCTGRSAAQQCKSSTFQTQCVGNGLWVSAAGDNQSLGQCTPRQCRDLPTIHGGDIRPRVNSVPVGSSLRVVCNRGFELRGPGSP